MSSPLTIVVPTLNEEEALPILLDRLAPLLPVCELLLVDGGSSDGTESIARARCGDLPAARFLTAERGRGSQLRRGCAVATGDALLLLHADSLPSVAMLREIEAFLELDRGRRKEYEPLLFRLQFRDARFPYRLYQWGAGRESLFTSFGDQGLLIGIETYRQIGPIEPIPLFEDVEFLRRARRRGTLRKSSSPITTSDRRFRENGPIITQLNNLRLLLLYLLGVDPGTLERGYRRGRGNVGDHPA